MEDEPDYEDLCAECGDNDQRVHEDPRDPPIDEGPCLCDDCVAGAYGEAVERAADRVFELIVDAREALGSEFAKDQLLAAEGRVSTANDFIGRSRA